MVCTAFDKFSGVICALRHEAYVFDLEKQEYGRFRESGYFEEKTYYLLHNFL